MSYHDEESSDIGPVGQSKLESFLFSCELSSKVPFYTFQGDEEEDLEHFLELRTVCLGEGCKEESNVVEVTAMNHQGKTISVPIANLHTNCLPMVSLGEFELKAPVTIRLKAGTGPVTVSGLHLIAPPKASTRNQPSSAVLGPDASAAEPKPLEPGPLEPGPLEPGPLEPRQARTVTPASGSRNSSPDCLASYTPDEVSDSVCSSDEEWVPPPKKDSSEDEHSSFPGNHKMEDADDNLMEIEGIKRVSSPDSLASSTPDEVSDSVCSSDEWESSANQDSSEDEYSSFPRDYKMEDEDDNLMEIEDIKWVSKNKSIKWSPSAEQTYRYVQAATKPVPGLTKYAKRNITDELKSCLDLFLTNDTIQLILKMTNLEGERTEKHWKDITETELRGFLGLLLLAGVYRSRGESTHSLWDEPIGRPVFRGTMSRKKFELIATKLRFDDKLTRRKRLSDNKLAAILPVWEPWVQRLSRMFNPGADVCVDEQLVGFKGRCSFRQYMPSKPAKYGIKIWTLADVSTSYAWNMAIYSGKEEASREVGQGKRVVLQMTQGLGGRTVTIDNFFTSYELGTELLRNKMAMVGTVRKGKPELPPQLLNVSGREVLSSVFAHTATHTVVSYVPRKGKNVVLMSTKHREASISEEVHKKPMIILDYNKCKGGVDNLDKCVGTYSCRRKSSRWPLTVFYNMLDVSAYNSYVLWTSLHPNWEIKKKYRRRIFLELLGKELVIPCILQRERIPRGPSAAAFVQAAQAAMVGEKEVRSEDAKEAKPGLLSPGAGAKSTTRRPCELCPESMKKTRVRNVCAKCGKFLCKDHTWKGCGTCLAGGQ